jgi:hypothetical protein
MQETSDEGRERADTPAAGGAGGVDEDTYQVELRGPNGLIGHAADFTFQRPHRIYEEGIEWNSLELKELFLSQTSALLVAQGMLLKELFPYNSYFATQPGNFVFSHGPYIFLKGKPTKVADPPPRLQGVLLAHVTKAPEGMSMDRLRGLILEQVL